MHISTLSKIWDFKWMLWNVALLQDGWPIAYVSINSTTHKYSPCRKCFHKYIYRCRVTVEFDHKPLKTIPRKPPGHTTTIIYHPGKDMQESTWKKSMDAQVHTLINSSSDRQETAGDLRSNGRGCSQQSHKGQKIFRKEENVHPISSKTGTTEMRYLRLKVYSSKVRKFQYLTNSEKKINYPAYTHRTYGHKKNQTQSMRPLFLAWNGETDQSRNRREQHIPRKTQIKNTRETMAGGRYRSLYMVGTRLCHHSVVDYNSRFLEMEQLPSSTSSAVSPSSSLHLQKVWSVTTSHIDSWYSSEEFRHFTDAWDLLHTHHHKSAPSLEQLPHWKDGQDGETHPGQSQGQEPSSLEYRNTPVEILNLLLISCHLHSIHPMTERKLQLCIAPHYNTINGHITIEPPGPSLTNLLAPLSTSGRQMDPVDLQQWHSLQTHRSCFIQTRDGQTLRWNCRSLRKSRETPSIDTQHTNTHARHRQPPHPQPVSHPRPDSQPQ